MNQFRKYKTLEKDMLNDKNIANNPDKHEEFQDIYFSLFYKPGFYNSILRQIYNINTYSIQKFYKTLKSKNPENEIIKKAEKI